MCQARRVCTRFAGNFRAFALAGGGGICEGGPRKGAGRMLLAASEADVVVCDKKGHALVVCDGRAHERPVTLRRKLSDAQR